MGTALEALLPLSMNLSLWVPSSENYTAYMRSNGPSDFTLVDDFTDIHRWQQTGVQGTIEQSNFSFEPLHQSISYTVTINKTLGTTDFILSRNMGNQDWTRYNTLGFWVYPQTSTPTVRLAFAVRNEDHWFFYWYDMPSNSWSFISIDISQWSRNHVDEIRLAEVGNAWGPYVNKQVVKLFLGELSVWNSNNQFVWTALNSAYLKSGWNNFVLNSASAGWDLDLLVLEPYGRGVSWNSPFSKIELEYNKVSSTEYTVLVNTSKPYFLVFSENYDSSWTVEMDGQTLEPFKAYGFANLYYIEKTGRYVINMRYALQTRYNFALTIVAITVVACIVLLLLPGRFLRILKGRLWKKHVNVASNRRLGLKGIFVGNRYFAEVSSYG